VELLYISLHHPFYFHFLRKYKDDNHIYFSEAIYFSSHPSFEQKIIFNYQFFSMQFFHRNCGDFTHICIRNEIELTNFWAPNERIILKWCNLTPWCINWLQGSVCKGSCEMGSKVVFLLLTCLGISKLLISKEKLKLKMVMVALLWMDNQESWLAF